MKVKFRIIKNENGMHQVQRKKYWWWESYVERVHEHGTIVIKDRQFPVYDQAMDFIKQEVDAMIRRKNAKRWKTRRGFEFEVK